LFRVVWVEGGACWDWDKIVGIVQYRHWVHEALQRRLVEVNGLPWPLPDELEVKVAFSTGIASREDSVMWYSWYIYCRRKEGDDTQTWGWRIVFDTDSDATEFIDAPLLVFNTIPELLAWYGSWSDRLNLDYMRGRMLGEGGEDCILGEDCAEDEE
jgi:hypothetical protein